ncbi:hypothetical protein LX36DRAFT_496899 [Colletotrichum falcatum]|nr:hypothetical protein LX36DRAFT_496899 [Colletotrichum falcatum]
MPLMPRSAGCSDGLPRAKRLDLFVRWSAKVPTVTLFGTSLSLLSLRGLEHLRHSRMPSRPGDVYGYGVVRNVEPSMGAIVASGPSVLVYLNVPRASRYDLCPGGVLTPGTLRNACLLFFLFCSCPRDVEQLGPSVGVKMSVA